MDNRTNSKIYTPKCRIPVCMLEQLPDGKIVLKFKKNGEQIYETMDLMDFIVLIASNVVDIQIENSKVKLSQMQRRS